MNRLKEEETQRREKIRVERYTLYTILSYTDSDITRVDLSNTNTPIIVDDLKRLFNTRSEETRIADEELLESNLIAIRISKILKIIVNRADVLE